MKTINLINIEHSDIDYDINYQGKEPILSFKDINPNEEYQVICEINCPSALYILEQLANYLDTKHIQWQLIINYLMGANLTRDNKGNLPILVNILNTFYYKKVVIYNPFDKFLGNEIRKCELRRPKLYYFIQEEYSIIFLNEYEKLQLNEDFNDEGEVYTEHYITDSKKILIVGAILETSENWINVIRACKDRFKAKISILFYKVINDTAIQHIASEVDEIYTISDNYSKKLTNYIKIWPNYKIIPSFNQNGIIGITM